MKLPNWDESVYELLLNNLYSFKLSRIDFDLGVKFQVKGEAMMKINWEWNVTNK